MQNIWRAFIRVPAYMYIPPHFTDLCSFLDWSPSALTQNSLVTNSCCSKSLAEVQDRQEVACPSAFCSSVHL